MWFDAADSSTFTPANPSNGQTITEWRDKSSNSNNLVQHGAGTVTSTGTYSATGYNGKPSVFMNPTGVSSYGIYSTQAMWSSNTINFQSFFPPNDTNTFFMVFSQTGGIVGAMSLQWTNNGSGNSHVVQDAGSGNLYASGPGINSNIPKGMGANLLVEWVTRGLSSTSESYDVYIYGAPGGTITYSNVSDSGYTWNFTDRFVIGAKDNTAAYYGIGYHAEYLMYNQALTTTQRQQVEGYLMWKWGLECVPQANLVSGITPTAIPGCQLWFDGADPAGTGTTPSNGATVSTWVDKSGNGYNATVASSRIGGTYNTASNCVYFQASNVGYVTSYPANPTSETMFVVFNNPSPSFNNNIIIGGQLGARSLGAGYSGASGTGSSQVVGNLNNEVAWLAATTTATSGYYLSGTTAIVTSQFTSSSNSISLNGGTFLSGGAPGFSNSTTTYLGVDTTTTAYYYIGYAMEIIFYNSILTTAQCQNIQAYLANKWGASLLNLNGYTPLLGSPLNIPRCTLWLDASDISTITQSGGAVSQWNDKSGTGNNATQSTPGNQPTYSLSNIYFNGASSNYMNLPNGTLPSGNSSYSIFFVVQYISGAQILGAGVTSNNQATFLGVNATNIYDAWYNIDANGGSSFSLSNATFVAESIYTADSNRQLFVSGTLTQTLASSNHNCSTLSNAIGGFIAQSIFGTFYAKEIIYYATALNTPQRQSVERYLSLKWGLSNYYTSIPGSVRGLMLWLDGADTTTMTFPSGSNVSGWRDKATLGFTLSNTISGQYPTYVSGKGLFCSNVSSVINASNQGLRYDGNWPFVVPTQSMSAFVSYTALCNDSYRNPVFISGTNGGSYTNRPNFIVSFQMGTSESSQLFFDLNGGNWTQAVTVNSNTSLGPRIDAIISSPGVTSDWIRVNDVEQTYSSSNAYSSTYSNYTPNVLYVAGMTATVQGSRNFHGYINEILFYSNALTSSERAVVQAYLASKWSNTTMPNEVLPLNHPFTSVRPFSRPFSPIDIPELSVWFDAADYTTLTLSGSTVTAWRDKSNNGWNATTLIGTAPTITTLKRNSAVSFAGSSTLTVSNVSFSSEQARGIFVVYRVDTSTPNYISWFSTQASGINNQGGYNNLVYPTGGGGPYLQSYAVGGGVVGMGADPAVNTVGTTALAVMIHSAVSTASNVVTLNGTSYALSTNNLASGYSTSNVTYYIGNAYPQPYILCEYIMYQSEITPSQRQQIEGYLAWKWDIQGSLPSTHPFYKLPSLSVLPFLPTNISSCSLWLDGSDIKTMTLSNSNVVQWFDKSGNGYHMTGTSYPLLVSSGIGGNSFIRFTQSSSQRLSNASFSTLIAAGPATYFLVEQNMAIPGGGNGGPFGFTGGSPNFGVIFQYNGGLQPFYLSSQFDFPFTSTTPRILQIYMPNAASGSTGRVNGSTTYNGSNILFGQNQSNAAYSGNFEIGHSVSGYVNVDFCELIVFNTSLTLPQIQQVEGYLAHKWGI